MPASILSASAGPKAVPLRDLAAMSLCQEMYLSLKTYLFLTMYLSLTKFLSLKRGARC